MSTPVTDGHLAFHIEGTGIPCLVFCASTTQIMERSLSPRLREHLRCIFVTPHFGIPIEAALDEVDALRRTLQLEQVAVMGHSSPGILALAYALRFPQHVSRVILIGTPPAWAGMEALERRYWDDHASAERKALRAQQEQRTSSAAEAAPVSPSDAFITDYVNRPSVYWHDPTYDCSALWEGAVIDVEEVTYHYSVVLPRLETLSLFPLLARPVFVALGRSDFAVPPTAWDACLATLPQPTRVIFEQSGHYPQMEERDAFDTALIDWLRT